MVDFRENLTYHEIEKAALTEPYAPHRIKATNLLISALRRYRAAVDTAVNEIGEFGPNFRDALIDLETEACQIDEDTQDVYEE